MVKMASDLEHKIIRQIEYYFGDVNLPRDKFLQEKIKEDEGWVTLEVLLTFKRLANLSSDPEIIVSAVEKSENKLVEVSEDRKKFRRNPEQPIPELDDERRKELMTRTESGRVIILLIRKKEIEERKKSKKEKKANVEEKPEKKLEFPKGAILHFTGLEEGQTLTREEVKEKIKEVGEIEVSFVDFHKGDLEGYARFPEENNAIEFLKKITDGELEVDKFKLKVRVLEGEEEEEYLKKTSEAVIELRKKQKQSGRNNRRRKGNFGNQSRDAKSRKLN
ncbi:hypothetical protein NQ314_002242 [Rhamnusium bicolor]|uniref:Uncharacterized protein n=1 Tax=Rhamnusium bicolor TaxID=1586634 RepID=A0AAV8ZRD3_9CUCU|nr:hypothetical protein NQ314_002242 [Rhamnusium bicolor]